MDKPTIPNGPNASPWPEESGSEQDFGATGVFQAVKPPEPVNGPAAGPGFDQGLAGNRATEAVSPQPLIGAKPLAEPVVHKVALGGGSAEGSTELLDRIRIASAEKAPAAAPSGRGSGGFTELLRTLESDSPASAVAPKAVPASEPARPAKDAGFTSLLRTLKSPGQGVAAAEEPKNFTQPAAVFTQEEPKKAPEASSPDSFTQMLQSTSAADPVLSGPPIYPAGSSEVPVGGGATPAPIENKPGTFTQMFGSLSGTEAGPAAPLQSTPPTEDSSRGSGGSFTRMLSLEPPTIPVEPPSYEGNKPAAGSLDYGLTPGGGGVERPAKPSGNPFSSQPLSEAPPNPSLPQSSGVGITRLIQMLDEPSKAPVPRREEIPVSPPQQGPGPGVWTQTFASLASPGDPPTPVAKAPDWASPQAGPSGTGFPAPPEVHPAASVSPPSIGAPAAAPATSGPSEFTRILDASRIREMAMRGGQVPAAEIPIAAPAPTPASMPSYPVPVSPPVVGMQSGGGVPRPVVYPPTVPQAPGMYVPQPQVPQAPGMYAPVPPPMPAAPQAPPARPAQTPANKLQQLVPVLLIVVIVLLVALIVTVIFLMKH